MKPRRARLDLGLFRAATTDRGTSRPDVQRARRAETQYARTLRRVAKTVGDIIAAFPPGDPASLPPLEQALRRYSEALDPWARAVAGRMIAEVATRDAKTWQELSQQIGRALRQEIEQAPTGQAMRQRLEENVSLIKSLPIEAAERVHKLTLSAITTGRRAEDIAREIAASGKVADSRAQTIARTEVARTATALTMARAEYIGSEGYVWMTSRDSRVRDSHAAMNGKFVRWSDPPTLDGMRGHAGEFPNCRCIPYPILPGEPLPD